MILSIVYADCYAWKEWEISSHDSALLCLLQEDSSV